MDLLNENQNKIQQSQKGKKIILALIIISILLVIGIIIAMIYIQSNKVKEHKIILNGKEIQKSNDVIVQTTDGVEYISLIDLAGMLEYKYDNSEYGKDGKDTAKCYIRNNKLIYNFELDSNKMFKYEEGTNVDYQYYNLKHNIITYQNKLYIALEDLQKGLNLSYSIDLNNNVIINSKEYLEQVYQEKLKDTGYTIAEDQNNKKALSYGWIVVKKDNLYSVLDINLKEKVGSKYKSIYFDELNQNYIVSNTNGKCGIISTEGYVQLQLIYDGLEILNYENMLYKVKNNGKYGIIKKDGNKLTEIEYDDIGYPEDTANKILYTLLVPQINGNLGTTIVVKQNNKYGLIYLETGETYLPCQYLDKLYSINDLGQIRYMVEVERQVYTLEYVLQYIMTQTINLN